MLVAIARIDLHELTSDLKVSFLEASFGDATVASVDNTLRERYSTRWGESGGPSRLSADEAKPYSMVGSVEPHGSLIPMKPTDMLAEVLRRGTLTRNEKESFEDMFDRVQRFGRCSDRQKAWIEKVYYGQKLDQRLEEKLDPKATFVRRRVVVPTWLNDKPEQGGRARAVETARIEPVGVRGPNAESSNPRQVLVKVQRSSKSGTFRATPVPLNCPRVAYINYPGVQRETPVTTLLSFEEVCPRIPPGSRQYEKVAAFFARGGVVLKIKPLAEVTQVA